MFRVISFNAYCSPSPMFVFLFFVLSFNAFRCRILYTINKIACVCMYPYSSSLSLLLSASICFKTFGILCFLMSVQYLIFIGIWHCTNACLRVTRENVRTIRLPTYFSYLSLSKKKKKSSLEDSWSLILVTNYSLYYLFCITVIFTI